MINGIDCDELSVLADGARSQPVQEPVLSHKEEMMVRRLAEGLLAQNRASLARAITLLESRLPRSRLVSSLWVCVCLSVCLSRA